MMWGILKNNLHLNFWIFFFVIVMHVASGATVIPDVPDYMQSDFAGSNDCTPVAAADVLGYWDANGFADLIAGPNDFAENAEGVTALVNNLKFRMAYSSSGTSVDAVALGIQFTAQDVGYVFAALETSYVGWEPVQNELDSGRPCVLTMLNSSYGGQHSVACVGYEKTADSNIIIVHDNWMPANDVYLNFEECSRRYFVAVVPTSYVDDDAPFDPAPGDPEAGDPLENGSIKHPFDSIQEAIDQTTDGVTILVKDGEYTSKSKLGIDLQGKSLKVRSENGPSNCIITGGEAGRAFMINQGETSRTSLIGFTITRGQAEEGGGLIIQNASLTIRNCVFEKNAALRGGAVFASNSAVQFDNCTFAYNSSDEGGAVFSEASSVEISNTIDWFNGPGSLFGGKIAVTYSNLEDGSSYLGDGNFSYDPLFADPASGDYHLKSIYGRWNKKWVYDEITSTCIDAGNPASPFRAEKWPNGMRVNIGAYGNTAEASRGEEWWTLKGDVNDDCKVNIIDLIAIRNHLSKDTSGSLWKFDVNADGIINIIDLIYVRNRLSDKCLYPQF